MIKNQRILHIFDNETIVKHTILLFEKLVEFNQHYVIIINADYICDKNFNNNKNIFHVVLNKNTPNELAAIINNYDVIFFQALSYIKAKVLLKYRFSNKIFVWGLWGYDLYNFVAYKNSNEKLFNNYKKPTLAGKIRDFYAYNVVYKYAIKKIDYCLFLLESDYLLLKKTLKIKAKWVSNCYQTIEQITKEVQDFKTDGNSILIGNSSNASNKHAYIFNKLNSAMGRKVICPLNYGDSEYRMNIVEVGKEKYKDSFFPLEEYLPFSLYLQLIRECSVTIMAHERQQAFGTILLMLYGGSKVYLSELSPLFNYLLMSGFAVFSIEKDLNENSLHELDAENKYKNKLIAINMFNESVILEKQRNILNEILDFNL